MQWLEDHISQVTDALMSRLNREAANGINRGRFQLYYHPSVPGVRGGLCVLPSDEDMSRDAWQPFGGSFTPSAMTRDQIRRRIWEASRTLPLLDPKED